MTSWNEGYVSDIEYLPGFYGQQTVAHINTACLLRNIEPPVADGEAFAYCELGCGVGESALAIAATSRNSEVWAFDFNPAHIARGQELARKGGLSNIRLEEASFEQLVRNPPAGMPQFDYITLHGVWAWVSAENRRHIVSFIEKHLKPGGAVYVTYNALPGWSSAMPLQHLVSTLAASGQGPSDKRVREAIMMLRRYADAGSIALNTEAVERLEKEVNSGNVAYLAHEYLNEHWQPCFHSEVASDLSAAKLEFVGAADLLENFPDLCIKPDQRAVLDASQASARETLKDYFMVRTFRRDVFIRGARHIPERRRELRLRDQRLMLIIPPEALRRDITIPLGEAELSERFYQPALEALRDRKVMSIGEMLDLPEAAGGNVSAREVLGMLCGSRQAARVVADVTAEDRKTAIAYNRNLLASCADAGRAHAVLASPVIGSALSVTLFEMLAYEALATDTPAEAAALARKAWQMLQTRGDKISHEGVIYDSEEENLAKLAENMAQIINTALPLWQRVGAL